MNNVNILVTCASGALAPALINHIRKHSKFTTTIIGTSNEDVSKNAYVLDKFIQVPLGSDPTYTDYMMNIFSKESVDFVIVGSDEEALALSKVKLQAKNELDCTILVSEHEVIELLGDKAAVYEKLKSDNIEVPPFKVVNNNAELLNALESFGYPQKTVVGKLSQGRGGRGFSLFVGEEGAPEWCGNGQRESRYESLSFESLKELIKVDSKTMIMPAMGTPCYDVDVLAHNGRLINCVIRERINPSGIPFKGSRFIDNTDIEKYCESICRSLKLNALHDIDLMTMEDGSMGLLEVNPRPSGALSASLKAGIPFIDNAIELFMFEREPEITSKNLVSEVIPVLDLIAY
ncbi:MAG: ATP-grasp domain-containing protein [Bdellovibrionota bacterium]|nr:ATP-grasp domain-containing protein [Bdellovibrionota bacterium]